MLFENFLSHVGVAHDENPPGRGSGRYEWGTGENPEQHLENMSLGKKKAALLKKGYSEKDVAFMLGYSSTTQLRNAITRDAEERTAGKSDEVLKLYRAGVTSPTEISKKLGIPEGTVRSYIKKDGRTTRLQQTEEIKDQLRKLVAEDKYVDVGIGVEYGLGITEDRKKYILKELEKEGYGLHDYYQTQIMNPGKRTTVKILCPPGVTKEQMIEDFKSGEARVHPVDRFIESPDGKRSILGLPPVNCIDSKRLEVVNDVDRDGLIELRRGVDDISLGRARYAQVRIGVDGKWYMKGMAAYSDNIPEGKDIVFYHSKGEDAPLYGKILKEMKTNKLTGEVDKDNPFGATIKNENELVFGQRYYIDKDGKEKVSAINIVNEEGDWTKWSRNTSSQFLSKQPLALIKQQLNLSYLEMKDKFADIKSIQNGSVRRVELENFAENCDKAAVDLKGASLPRQQTHVILPLRTLKNNEVFAPNYENGEEVILVRFPHEGTFEIPRLTVNNKNREGQKLIGTTAPDAIGIPGVAARQLSGADFDGDSVVVIPLRTYPGSNKYNPLTAEKARKDLVDFDTKAAYPAYEGMIPVKKQKGWDKQMEMGKVSNLITDMTLFGAPPEDIIKATKHAMVIIDAEKHNLDWKKSERDNDILALKKKWQGSEKAGAKTIISRASAEKYVEENELRYDIDPDTGAKINIKSGKTKMGRVKVGVDESGRAIYEDTGKYVPVMQKSTKMREAKDAYELVSDPEKPHKKEVLYADYANAMKKLANEARLEYANTPTARKNIEASKVYEKEVKELEDMVVALNKNAPRERVAQRRASINYYQKRKERDDLDKDDLKKLRVQCLAEARAASGTEAMRPILTSKQWQAIENHAISGAKAEKIIKKMRTEDVLSYALPREGMELSAAKKSLIRAYGAQGKSIADIAEEMHISTSTVQKYLKQ